MKVLRTEQWKVGIMESWNNGIMGKNIPSVKNRLRRKDGMMSFLKKALFVSIVLIIVTGCLRDPKPSNTLKREKFIRVLTDMHIGESMFLEKNRIKVDSLQSKSIYLSVLKKHNVTEKQMEETVLYYSRHPRDYDKIYTEVVSRMQSMNEQIQGEKKSDILLEKKLLKKNAKP